MRALFNYFFDDFRSVLLPFVGSKAISTFIKCFGCLALTTYWAVFLTLTVKFLFFQMLKFSVMTVDNLCLVLAVIIL